MDEKPPKGYVGAFLLIFAVGIFIGYLRAPKEPEIEVCTDEHMTKFGTSECQDVIDQYPEQ